MNNHWGSGGGIRSRSLLTLKSISQYPSHNGIIIFIPSMWTAVVRQTKCQVNVSVTFFAWWLVCLLIKHASFKYNFARFVLVFILSPKISSRLCKKRFKLIAWYLNPPYHMWPNTCHVMLDHKHCTYIMES